MKQLRVRDIMTTDVFTLSRDETLQDAARALSNQRIGGAPVVDNGRIVGVVSKSDLLEVAAHRNPAEGRLYVNDVMTHLVFAVRPGDPAIVAVRLMVEEGVHRAVVVDDQGKLAGVVTPMDVLRAIVRGEQIQEAEAPDSDFMPHAEPAVAVQYVDLREFSLSA